MSKSLAESDFMDALGYIAYTLDALKAAQHLLAAFDETLQRIAEFPSAHKIYCTGRPMKDEICKVPVKKLCAVLRRLSKPRGDSPLSLWQESQK
jgi:hypothetical protein